MKLALVTDAWRPQVNGVVTTLGHTRRCLEQANHTVLILSPTQHFTVPLPGYAEIRVALNPGRRLARILDDCEPDSIHIATEGPLGMAARRYCLRNRLAFTTSYHTQFPEYLRKRLPIPESWSYRFLRRFHEPAQRTMVPTEQQRLKLAQRGFDNLVLWSRGVDTAVFAPQPRDYLEVPRPIWMYAGRVAVEKNLEEFLRLDLPGTKFVVGGGPDLERLKKRYPDAQFPGYRFGHEMARYLSCADVFVFPSRTDTFGLVMLEALACGTPVAAFPVTGPIDVIEHGVTGILDEDLGQAARAALDLSREECRSAALERSWERASTEFLSHLVHAKTGLGIVDHTRTSSAAPAIRSRPLRADLLPPAANGLVAAPQNAHRFSADSPATPTEPA